ncbi:MAG: SAM-dependent methyltransferase [Capnocytophaga sp.]|nr:SAM-dependent methyltransferase [Capnocytophaga sp.]
MSTQGTLYLIPTFLGDSIPQEVLPAKVVQTVASLTHFIVENEKSARKFIKQILPEKPQSELVLYPLNKHTKTTEIPTFLEPCQRGISIGILSEAGCPGIADPGAEIVRLAHRNHIKVVPLVGPSSILLAMMASGMNGQSFAFNGYLPIDRQERRKELKQYERKAIEQSQSQIFIETPYRNDKLLIELTEALQPNTLLCIACDITLPGEWIQTHPVSQWKKTKIDLQKRPAIFIIGR